MFTFIAWHRVAALLVAVSLIVAMSPGVALASTGSSIGPSSLLDVVTNWFAQLLDAMGFEPDGGGELPPPVPFPEG